MALTGASGAVANALELDAAAEPVLVRRILSGDAQAARSLITANNQRLYRAAWSILKNRAEAEDVVQEAYAKGFAALSRFKGQSSLSTWLTRIVINEALERRRAAQRRQRGLDERGVDLIEDYREALMQGSMERSSPEQALARRELARMVEGAIGQLPEAFRLVFVLREVEGLSVAETADAVQITEQTVKTRLFRAKQRLQAALKPELDHVRCETLPFAGVDCEALTVRVLKRLGFS